MDLKEDFHVHCNYNDHSAADLTVRNVINKAESIGLETLAFTEHVRKSSEWVPRYLDDIASVDSRVQVISGFEAKILQDGSIDCLDKYASEHFVVASFHTVYNDKQIWIRAVERAIENPNVDVIGHIAPEPSFTLDTKEIERLAELIASYSKKVELNAKYHRPPTEWLAVFKDNGVQFHLGSDAHSLAEIGNYQNIMDLIAIVDSKIEGLAS
jgi:putative hydrolase